VNPDLRALMMDPGKVLLITCEDQIAATADGKTFSAKAKGSLEAIRGAKTPMFQEREPRDG
jgi:hypothetical protein